MTCPHCGKPVGVVKALLPEYPGEAVCWPCYLELRPKELLEEGLRTAVGIMARTDPAGAAAIIAAEEGR